ncbi:MAG: hypothetical protein ACNYWU_07765, partial [Desulfobacterales bacterium]
DVSAAIIILTLSTLHGRRAFDIQKSYPFNVLSLFCIAPCYDSVSVFRGPKHIILAMPNGL